MRRVAHLTVNLIEEESENMDSLNQRKEHRVVLVRYMNQFENSITIVDQSYSIEAFLEATAWEKVKENKGYRSLSSLKGSVIRVSIFLVAFA